MTRISSLVPLVLLLTNSHVSAEIHVAPWRIVSASDWHSAEGGVTSKDPAAFAANQSAERERIRGTVFCDPDVVLIAGDVGSGHWTTGALKRAGALLPGETAEQAIERLGRKTYRSMKDNFAAAGVDRLFLAIGDHGLGDNDWPAGSERARCVPFHRAVFGRSYNMDDQGNWLWPDKVCGVTARPMGTKYVNTSFAVQHKNVVFVMVDVFHQEEPDDRLHPRHGSVLPDLVGNHLAWFERVLKAASQDASVQYVFVAGHTPALPPVRAQSTSMMMAHRFDRSRLWRAMRRHGVDIYFAGEVHATTLSKDPESDLVQLVTDRNLPTMLTIHTDKIELQCFDRSLAPDGSVQKQPLLEMHRLTIDKSGSQMTFRDGKGYLKPLDTSSLFIHYTFDDILARGGRDAKPAALVNVPNHGELGRTYDARAKELEGVAGKLGKAIQLGDRGVVDVRGTGPFGSFDGTQRTLALWMKTTAGKKYNLICGGSGLPAPRKTTTGWMDLGVDAGRLFVRTSAGQSRVKCPLVNDGQWHHVALVVADDARTLRDVKVYLDGQPQPWAAAVEPSAPINARMAIYGISLGGSHRPVWRKSKRNKGVDSFDGLIDDFGAWYRALSDTEIQTLYRLGDAEALNASQVDKRFATR